MELFERYIQEVGGYLPEKTRGDIQMEIRSLLEDTLEDRCKAEGLAADEGMAISILKEFGAPGKVAASYLQPRYLIGPRLYPIFTLALKIVLIVLGILALVQLAVSLGQPGPSIDSVVTVIIHSLTSFIGAALQALGNIVVIFAILQWAMPNYQEKSSEWDPRAMKPVNDTELVRLSTAIGEIIAAAAGILIFNFLFQWAGPVQSLLSPKVVFLVPTFTAEFYRYLPWLDLLWVLNIGLYVALLRQGRWQPVTRWVSVGLKIFSLVILGAMLSGAPIVTFTAAGLPETTRSALQPLFPMFQALVPILLILLIVLTGGDLVTTFVRLFRKNTN